MNDNTAATDIDFLRYRRRQMCVYRGSSGIRTKQHRHHRYRLSPISTVSDVGISGLIRQTNEITLRPTISTYTDIDGRRCGYIKVHQADERNNTAATDIDFLRYRRRQMWVYRGSSGTRTYRPPLTPITTPKHPHIGYNRA